MAPGGHIPDPACPSPVQPVHHVPPAPVRPLRGCREPAKAQQLRSRTPVPGARARAAARPFAVLRAGQSGGRMEDGGRASGMWRAGIVDSPHRPSTRTVADHVRCSLARRGVPRPHWCGVPRLPSAHQDGRAPRGPEAYHRSLTRAWRRGAAHAAPRSFCPSFRGRSRTRVAPPHLPVTRRARRSSWLWAPCDPQRLRGSGATSGNGGAPVPQRNDDHEDAWLREQIEEILEQGWTMDELDSVGITRAMLTRLGFRDDHPRLFDEPKPRPRRKRPDPGGRRAKKRTEAASRMQRDAASTFCGSPPFSAPPPPPRSAGRAACRSR